MAFDCPKRKNTRLYSDLFKCSVEKEEENRAMSTSLISSSSSSPSGSSSSGFSTPFYSDFDSSDGDFIAELTRQMAECMLQDDDDDEKVLNEDSHAISSSVKNKEQSYVDYGGSIHNLKNSVLPFQVNELKNQPLMSEEGHFCRGRRAKRTESAQQKAQQHYRQYRGRNGSGMQAVFLGGSGSRSGPPGTGVFMPRVTGDPNELKKKSGCSIVLMPTRVLQTLEHHFKQRHLSTVPSLSLSGGSASASASASASLVHSCPKPKGADETTVTNGHSQGLGNREEMQLPQEWTY